MELSAFFTRVVGWGMNNGEFQYPRNVQLRAHFIIFFTVRSVQLNVQVIDINDNVPTFVYPETSKRFAKNAYYGAIASDKEIGSAVLQVRAEDLDGGKLGDVTYELTDDGDRNTSEGPYFAVDPKTGVVKTLRTLTDVPARSLPFRLVVTARDNPGAANPSDYNTAQAHVVVSVEPIITRIRWR